MSGHRSGEGGVGEGELEGERTEGKKEECERGMEVENGEEGQNMKGERRGMREPTRKMKGLVKSVGT